MLDRGLNVALSVSRTKSVFESDGEVTMNTSEVDAMSSAYPRDLRGYGRHTPDPRWPGQARIALQVVLNFEEGGENNVLHGDPGSETFLSEIMGAKAYPARHMSMESIYEYGTRAGFWRLYRCLTARSVPVTVYGVAMALARHPEAVAAMREADWEIASHGYRWIDYQFVSAVEEKVHLQRAVALHTALTGSRPLGWYTGRDSPNTRAIVLEEGGFLYDSDSYADDLPYWHLQAGAAPHLIIPYTLDVNDMRFASPQGFNSGDQFFCYLKDTFDVLYAEGESAPKMMNLGLHCRIAGRPGRVAALMRFLDYAASHDGVWWSRRIDIARHWHAEHLPENT